MPLTHTIFISVPGI